MFVFPKAKLQKIPQAAKIRLIVYIMAFTYFDCHKYALKSKRELYNVQYPAEHAFGKYQYDE